MLNFYRSTGFGIDPLIPKIQPKMLPTCKNPYNHYVYKGFCEGRRIRTFDRLLRRQVLYPAELCVHLSGWQDSNLRPPAPKAGAITGLRYTPKEKKAESKGFEPLVQFPIRMFSKHVLSATQATLQ